MSCKFRETVREAWNKSENKLSFFRPLEDPFKDVNCSSSLKANYIVYSMGFFFLQILIDHISNMMYGWVEDQLDI